MNHAEIELYLLSWLLGLLVIMSLKFNKNNLINRKRIGVYQALFLRTGYQANAAHDAIARDGHIEVEDSEDRSRRQNKYRNMEDG